MSKKKQSRYNTNMDVDFHQDGYLEDWDSYTPVKGNSVFTVGEGRSGTHFIAELMDRNSLIDAYHLDDIKHFAADSFLFYSQYYELNVDNFGFFASRNHLIQSSKEKNNIYLESNPYISLSITPLYNEFDCKFIYLYRRPEEVVNSHNNKDWYKQLPGIRNHDQAIGYQYYIERTNHFFGRIAPRGKDEFNRWLKLTRIGKIAWKWNVINLRILEQLKNIPTARYLVISLDDFNYQKYVEALTFVGGQKALSPEAFKAIEDSRPGNREVVRTINNWTARERDECKQESVIARTRLGIV